MIFLRRLLYLLFCTAAFFYYIFHTGYLSWVLLTVAVSLPILSIAATLLIRRGLRVQMRADAFRSAGFSLILQITPALPYTAVRLRLCFENLFTQEKTYEEVFVRPGQHENTIVLPYDNTLCGVVRCTVKGARMLDLLGLFLLPLPKPAPLELLSLPKEVPFSGEGLGLQGLAATSVQRQNAAGLAGERDLCDIRDYRPGDSLRDVHWKLTARTGRPIVREYGLFADSVRTVALHWAGTPENLALSLSRFLGVVRFFSGHGPYAVLWLTGSSPPRRYVSPDTETLAAVLWDALSKPPAGNGGPSGFPTDSSAWEDPFLLACPEAIFLYEEGARREVVS